MDDQPLINLTVKRLKEIIENLPDEMNVVIPVIDEDDANHIYGFRFVRTAGVLTDLTLPDDNIEKNVLCINSASGGRDITSQLNRYGSSIDCKTLLF